MDTLYILEFVRYQPPQADTSGMDANHYLPNYAVQTFPDISTAAAWVQANQVPDANGVIALFRIISAQGFIVS